MMRMAKIAALSLVLLSVGCKSNQCDSNQAYNKMLALNKVQSRMVSKGGEAGMAFAAMLAKESAPVSELIAQGKFPEACQKAEEIAKQHGMDLENEQKDMISMEQLAKDGGKGSGTCSVADAAKKLMEIHGLLQAEVDAGKKSSDIFREYNDDTKSFGELLSTNPSEACALLEKLRVKYGV